MPKFIDRTGEKFGVWTVISRAENKGDRVHWIVRCDCGEQRIYRIDALQEGRAKSCRICTRTHGMTNSTEYGIWRGMIKRCHNPNNNGFKNYGARGIKVCDRWRNSFDAFYEDTGNRPSDNHSIDRINNNGNYEPSNCRWATQKEQCRNYSQNKLVEHQGRVITVTELSEITGVDRGLLYNRFRRNYSVSEALSKPIDQGKSRKQL